VAVTFWDVRRKTIRATEWGKKGKKKACKREANLHMTPQAVNQDPNQIADVQSISGLAKVMGELWGWRRGSGGRGKKKELC